jgi:probable rRNA maturation factor
MILIDPELEPGPSRQLRGLSRLPLVGSAAPRPSSEDASPRANWRRSALPWTERVPTPQTLTRFLARAQKAVGLRGQVTVLLTGDAAMRDLNRRFRGKNKPTDVLSFPATDLVQDQKEKPEKGDVAISVETARRQSSEQGHALAVELKVLMLHGLLHLAGYNHETDAGEMQRRERTLRARLGLPLGLIERAAQTKRKATADPSTLAARAASAQDDRAKRVPKRNTKRAATLSVKSASGRRRKP